MLQQVKVVRRISANMEVDDPMDVSGKLFSIQCPDSYIIDVLRNEYSDMLEHYAEMTLDEIEFVVANNDFSFDAGDVIWGIIDNESSDFYDLFVVSLEDVHTFGEA